MVNNCYLWDDDANDWDPALKAIGVKALDDRLKAAGLVNLKSNVW